MQMAATFAEILGHDLSGHAQDGLVAALRSAKCRGRIKDAGARDDGKGTGFSGGGRVACNIAFSLPEYFGGVIPIGSAGELRPENWLRKRCPGTQNRFLIEKLPGKTPTVFGDG